MNSLRGRQLGHRHEVHGVVAELLYGPLLKQAGIRAEST